MRVDPATVHEYAKDVWRIADEMARVRADSNFSHGSAACEGTDLVAGLAAHTVDQHSEMQALASRCDDFGTSLKRAADNFLRQEDTNTRSLADIDRRRDL